MCADGMRRGRQKETVAARLCQYFSLFATTLVEKEIKKGRREGRKKKRQEERERSQNTVKEVCYKKSVKLTVEKFFFFFFVDWLFFFVLNIQEHASQKNQDQKAKEIF